MILTYGFLGNDDAEVRMCLSTSRGLLMTMSCVPERFTTRPCPAKDRNQIAWLRTRSRVSEHSFSAVSRIGRPAPVLATNSGSDYLSDLPRFIRSMAELGRAWSAMTGTPMGVGR